MKLAVSVAAFMFNTVCTLPVLAEPPVAIPYMCDKEIRLEVVYVNSPEPALAIVLVDGSMHVMTQRESGSGSQYAEAVSGEYGLVWFESGDMGILERETGPEMSEVLAENCRAQ